MAGLLLVTHTYCLLVERMKISVLKNKDEPGLCLGLLFVWVSLI